MIEDLEVRLDSLADAILAFNEYQADTLPLCAAETPISRFAKLPLSGDFQERYIVGNTYSFVMDDNFIGSEFLLPFYKMVHDECAILFGSKFADPRPLSGMNCLTTILMTLTKVGDSIAILPMNWGGHQSVRPICERLGLDVVDLPYEPAFFDIDYDRANQMIDEHNVEFILLAPSDIINPFAVEKFDLEGKTLLYDISQIMGLIAGGVAENKLECGDRVVLFGGTHKTLPGPASGLILTNNVEIHDSLEVGVNPTFIRHTQMHQVISLLLALMEMEAYGRQYGEKILDLSNALGASLAKTGYEVASIDGVYSRTHQLLLFTTLEEMHRIERNAILHQVTLNKKEKAIVRNSGIRLGVQEIARYDWPVDTSEIIAQIIAQLGKSDMDGEVVDALRKTLPPKRLSFTFPDELAARIEGALHEK